MSQSMNATAEAGGAESPVDTDGAAKPPHEGRLTRFKAWFRRWHRRNWLSIYTSLLLGIFALMVLAPYIVITIPAGHVGVLWLRFFGGTVTDTSYSEGVHLIFPWDEMYIYDARLQNNARTYDTISSNGLTMQVEIAVRYRINRETVGTLHKVVGPDYPEILVYPEIGSHARELISRYTPEQLYTETRGFIQSQILERMVTQLGASLANQSLRGHLVQVQDVLLRSVVLPKAVAAAIERKAEQYQAMLEYDFRIAREEKERVRKRVEAEGIRDFQEVVSRNITPEYLRLRGIEATMALATSQNSKILVIGGGKDGLPVILNTGDMDAQKGLPDLRTLDASGTAAPGPGAAGHGAGTDADRPPLNARMSDLPAVNATGAVPPGTGAGMPSGTAAPVPTGEAVPKSPPTPLAPPERLTEGVDELGHRVKTIGRDLAPRER